MFLPNLYRKFEDRVVASFLAQPENRVRLVTRLTTITVIAGLLLYYLVFWRPLGSFAANAIGLVIGLMLLGGLIEALAVKRSDKSANDLAPPEAYDRGSSVDRVNETTQEFDWHINDPAKKPTTVEPPPKYENRYYYMDLVLGVAAPAMLILISLIGLILLLIYGGRLPSQAAVAVPYLVLILILTLLASAFAVYRRKWIWDNWGIVCDPQDGLLNVCEPGNKWLGVGGSPPDPYSVDEVKLVTPKRSWLHELVFPRANKLDIEGGEGSERGTLRTIEWAMDVEKLLLIQSYRKRINIGQNDRMIQLLESIDRKLGH